MKGLLISALAGLALLTTVSCRQDSTLPTDPVAEPGLNATTLATVPFHQISAGFSGLCAVSPDNRAYCWTNGTDAAPVPIPGNQLFRSVSVGGNGFTCGIGRLTDRLYCWGNNSDGALGNGMASNQSEPTPVASKLRFRQVSAGSHHVCAVTLGDIVYCWGWNGFGQLGDGTRIQRLVPTRVAGWNHFSKVSAGNYHSCGVTLAGKGFCWGDNAAWQIGRNAPTQANQLRPGAIVGGLTFSDVQAGYYFTCGVTTGHQAYCWGLNGPQLGSRSSSDDDYQRTPRLVAGRLAFRAISGGYYHTCGVTTGNVAYCWGSGYLDDGNHTESWTPVRVSAALWFRQVTAGGHASCGVTLDYRAFCWAQTPTQLPGPE